MKKLETIFFTFIITIVIFGIINLKFFENLYGLTTVVFNVSYSTDIVTVKDFNGNLWQFDGAENWVEGDICTLIMNSKGTIEIKDDTIISVRYSGYFEGWN